MKLKLDKGETGYVALQAGEAGMTSEEWAKEAVLRYGDLKRFEEARMRDHEEIMDLLDDAMAELRRLARPGAFAEGAMPFLAAMERLAKRTGREPILKNTED